MGCNTPEDTTSTMRPYRRARMPGSASRVSRMTLRNMLSKWVFHVASADAIPDIQIVLLEQTNERAGGAGETQTPIVPGAIANAIFDAAGIRMRAIPFTANRVKLALQGGRADQNEGSGQAAGA